MLEAIKKAEEAFKEGRPGQAMTILSRVLSEEPENRRALMSLGAVSQAMGQSREASQAFAKILELDPEDAEARRSLALCLISLKELPKAKAHLERLLASNQNDFRPWTLMSGLERAMGREEAAISHARRSLLINPDQPELLAYLESASKSPQPPEPVGPRPASAKAAWARKSRLAVLSPPGPQSEADLLFDGLSARLETTRVRSLKPQAYREAAQGSDILWLEGAAMARAFLPSAADILPGRETVVRLWARDVLEGAAKEPWAAWPDRFVFPSLAAREAFISQGPGLKPGARLGVVPRAADLGAWPYRERVDAARVVSLVDPGDGPLSLVLLLEAFLCLREARPGLELCLMGPEPSLAARLALNGYHARLGRSLEYRLPGPLMPFLDSGGAFLALEILAGQAGWIPEAIGLGLRPLVRRSPGAEEIYPPGSLWQSLGDLPALLDDGPLSGEGPGSRERAARDRRDFVARLGSPAKVAAECLAFLCPVE
jgi:tetratricopeptide (TPR) repeat protein